MTDSSTEIDAKQLALLAQAGSADAFDTLSRYYRPRLVALLVSQHNSLAADAEDAVQEALTKAFINIQRFDPQFSFSTWLFTIAIRVSQDQKRQRLREIKKTESFEYMARAKSHSAMAETEKTEYGIWHIAQEVLRPIQYQMLWMRYGESKSIKEIATELNRSSLAVRVTLHRARSALQQIWSRQ